MPGGHFHLLKSISRFCSQALLYDVCGILFYSGVAVLLVRMMYILLLKLMHDPQTSCD